MRITPELGPDAADAHTGAMQGFEAIKAAYPPFSGRQDWVNAQHFCNLRIDQGATWQELLEAAQRYARYCAAGGVSTNQYVLTPGKFFSAADRPWTQAWNPPAAIPKPTTQRRVAKTADELEAEEAARATGG